MDFTGGSLIAALSQRTTLGQFEKPTARGDG